jgi:hypothetical protein
MEKGAGSRRPFSKFEVRSLKFGSYAHPLVVPQFEHL